MIYRCTKPQVTSYPRYGGRGIAVCDRWRESFQSFLEDMGQAPDGMSLDRVDNDGNYEPDNCRWATPKEQANNTSANHVVEWLGGLYTVTKLAEIVGVSRKRIYHRLGRGMSVEDAIKPAKKYTYKEQARG
jgi:hypothetical protein